MLLSFSVDFMLPMVRAGIRQAHGEDVGKERVKRQTIRRRGPRAEVILKQADPHHFHAGTLHLWWKSRTKERAFLGQVTGFEIYPIRISRDGLGNVSVGCALSYEMTTHEMACADGFKSAEEFGKYFVPNRGDVFNGVVFKW